MAIRSGAFFLFISLLFIITWFACGIYVFTSGFLLSRREINITSTCQNDERSIEKPNTCWRVPSIVGTYEKVVIIIIDALRFDFAFYQDSSTNDLPYINKLKVFRDLASEYGCANTRLFKFRADAPTTTMQRIKGMMTGSFPTFIDISNNFDSSEISEDNLIDQILRNDDANLTFMGDDTWIKLFPERFKNSFPYPSFDVKDLHLVDNGIIEHLVPELEKPNWKVLIAHFLGVDHCGHRYGPMHSEMAAKLKQMDNVIRSVVERMDSNTLLLVMGDHGMTRTGDHGGETIEEIDSALFVFSRNGKFAKPSEIDSANCDNGLVHQIDIVPTLSLLLGTPIPFSNLGSVIADFIPDTPSSNLREALLTNARQIATYLKEYSTRYSEFNSAEFRSLMEKFAKIDDYDSNTKEILPLLYKARELCKSIWARFDEKSMVLGACLVNAICILLLNVEKRGMQILLCTTIAYWTFYFVFPAEFQFLILVLAAVLMVLHVTYCIYKGKIGIIGLISVLFPLLYFSNSFVVNEDAIVLYLYSTCISVISIRAMQLSYFDSSKKQVKTKKSSKGSFKFIQNFVQLFKRPNCVFVMLVASIIVILRSVFLFRVCRPEQFWCFAQEPQPPNYAEKNTTSYVIYAADDFFDFNNTWTRLFVSGGSLVAILLCVKRRLQQEGNLRAPFSASVLCTTRLLPLAVLCIIANWQLHTLPAKELDVLPVNLLTFLPRCAYVLLLLSLLWWVFHPLTVHLLYQDKFGRFRDHLTLTDTELASYYFKQIKQQYDDNSNTTQRKKSEDANSVENSLSDIGKPAVFGLYTLFSAALIGFGTVFLLFGAMLLEEKYAIVLLAFVVSTRILLEILSAIQHRRNSKSFDVSWDVVGLWALSCSFWWFVTGHQASLSSIPWNAAFVGFRGSHPTVALPAVMVGANIYISQILHTVFLPLLLLWPITRGYWFSQTSNKKSGDIVNLSTNRSEFDFIQSSKFWNSYTELFYKHIFMHAIKVFGCVCAAFIHRRHLMVWQIFAPRFVYEGLGFFVVCGTSLLMFLFTALFKRSFNVWIRKEKLNAATFVK